MTVLVRRRRISVAPPDPFTRAHGWVRAEPRGSLTRHQPPGLLSSAGIRSRAACAPDLTRITSGRMTRRLSLLCRRAPVVSGSVTLRRAASRGPPNVGTGMRDARSDADRRRNATLLRSCGVQYRFRASPFPASRQGMAAEREYSDSKSSRIWLDLDIETVPGLAATSPGFSHTRVRAGQRRWWRAGTAARSPRGRRIVMLAIRSSPGVLP